MMTPEQLDEIEKLADGWHRTGLTQYAEEVADNGRALVKALREALVRAEKAELALIEAHKDSERFKRNIKSVLNNITNPEDVVV